jgi:hypothetical protein
LTLIPLRHRRGLGIRCNALRPASFNVVRVCAAKAWLGFSFDCSGACAGGAPRIFAIWNAWQAGAGGGEDAAALARH